MAGLKTFSIQAFEDGKKCHTIIQRHVSGEEIHPKLDGLPFFPLVEKDDFDPQMKFEVPFNDKYMIHGFTDGRNPETGELLEIKTGRTWSAGDFAKLMQWRIYSLALPEYRKVWLINTPFNPEDWNRSTIKIFNTMTSPADNQKAKDFIERAIFTIENLKDAIQKEMETKKAKGQKGRDFNCFYENCSWCRDGGM